MDWLAEKMREANFTVSAMHGEQSQKERDSVMKEFRSGSTLVVFHMQPLITCFSSGLAEWLSLKKEPLLMSVCIGSLLYDVDRNGMRKREAVWSRCPFKRLLLACNA